MFPWNITVGKNYLDTCNVLWTSHVLVLLHVEQETKSTAWAWNSHKKSEIVVNSCCPKWYANVNTFKQFNKFITSKEIIQKLVAIEFHVGTLSWPSKSFCGVALLILQKDVWHNWTRVKGLRNTAKTEIQFLNGKCENKSFMDKMLTTFSALPRWVCPFL